MRRIRITGPNGAGKSTLLRHLAGLDGTPRDDASMVFQDARDGLVGLTVAGEHRLRGRSGGSHQDVATLSHGEAGRLAIHLLEGNLWLLDEPANGLDAHGVAQLRAKIQAHPGPVVFVDHGELADLATEEVELGAKSRFTWPDLRQNGPPQTVGPLNLQPGANAILGPNGCGKTQLLQQLASDHTLPYLPAEGKDALHRPTVRAEIAQAPDALRAIVPEAWLERHPWTLSGGEAKRVALVKILARPGVLLLDEPETHLDAEGKRWLAAHLNSRTVVLATHDPELAAACHIARQWP